MIIHGSIEGAREAAGGAPRGPSTEEAARLAALHRYAILDSAREAAFDDVAQLAADLFDAPVAQVNFIDERRQWTKADVRWGEGAPADGADLSLDRALCGHAYRADDVLVVPDLRTDPRFSRNPFVLAEPGARFYAAAPLRSAGGHAIGTVCVVDLSPRPRGATERQRRGLRTLAAQVMRELELRLAATDAKLEEARFRALATAPAASGAAPVLFRATADGAVTDAVGRAADEGRGRGLRGFAWMDAVHPDDRSALAREWGRSIAAGAPARLEFRARGPDGAWRWMQSHAAPVRAPDGRVVEWVGTVADIDAQRRAEAALRESEDHYRHAVELDPRTTWTAAPDGQLDHVNSRWFEWTGTSGLGSGYVDALHPDDRERTVACWTRSVLGGQPYDIEHRVRMRDGRHHWMHSRAFPRRDAAGRIVKWYGTTEDVDERREAEVQLRLRTEELESLLTSAPLGLCFFDREHRWLRINEELAAVNGLPVEAHVGRRLEELLPVNAASVGPMLDRVFATGEAVRNVEVTGEVPREPGVARHWLVSYYPVRAGGEVAAVGAWVIDITARKEAEARARELLATVDLGTFMARDLGGAIRFWSAGMQRLYGWTAEEALGRSAHELLGTEHPAPLAEIEAALERDGAWAGDLRHRTKRGDRIVVAAQKLLRRTADDGAVVLEALTDVTEQRRAEAALAESEARLRAVVEAAPVGLVFADAAGRITGGNAQVEQIIGHPVLPSTDFEDYDAWVSFHPDGRRVESREYPLARALADGEERPELEVMYQRGDGRCAWVRFIAAATRDADGRVTGGVVASLDIDREKRLTQELSQEVERALAGREEALAQLHEARKLETIGQLTGGVAHDFNNLLTPIVGALDLLRRRLEGDARAERLVGGALQSAERAKTLVQRLLSFARRQTLQPSAVDAAALVGGMRDLIDRSLGPGIGVEVRAAPGLPAALVDPNQLELALLNLAVNARDAMPDGGRLTIAVDAEREAPDGLPAGRFVRLAVTDTGQGMDAATLARAIEPFFSTKGVGKGTGLGLSMVHGLAAQSGGAFRLASEPGRGTVATLWLPVAPGAAEAAAGDASPAPSLAPRGATLLLVDDEPLVRATAAESLRELGYRVVEAGGAGEALDKVAGGLTPDLVVTDHAMPGLTGAELAGRLAERLPGVPVLLMTGFADLSADRTRDLAVLPKPFRQAELAARVAELLG